MEPDEWNDASNGFPMDYDGYLASMGRGPEKENIPTPTLNIPTLTFDIESESIRSSHFNIGPDYYDIPAKLSN